MTISLSRMQADGVAAIKEWYVHGRERQQVFRVFGYAGVGKTTTIKHAIDALGLSIRAPGSEVSGGALFAAYTGKASLVMQRAGTPAQTIHSLIYKFSPATDEEIEAVEKQIADITQRLDAMLPAAKQMASQELARLSLYLTDLQKPKFVLNTESELADADLLVLDEVSMVGEGIGADLLAFGKPILVLGDPGQLPPINGQGFFTAATPDVMLTEIHRQAKESAILQLATMAREGRLIEFGMRDGMVAKIAARDANPAWFAKADQVICGLNATRRDLNNTVKRIHGFSKAYPTGAGEKIICLKNNKSVGVVNGMFLTLDNVKLDGGRDGQFSAEFLTETGISSDGENHFWTGEYDNHIEFDPKRANRDWRIRQNLIETTWGYAITCHKAQGSQWDNVIVYDEGFGKTELDRKRWLYTAITRAQNGLVILA